MGKKIKSKAKAKVATDNEASGTDAVPPSLFGNKDAVIDPMLASLFANSAGPIKSPELKQSLRSSGDKDNASKPAKKAERGDRNNSNLTGSEEPEPGSEDGDSVDNDDEMPDVSSEGENDTDKGAENDQELDASPEVSAKSRKRKRGEREEALEDSYMRKLVKEEEKDSKKRAAGKETKRQKATSDATNDPEDEDSASGEETDEGDGIDGPDSNPPPVHESLSGSLDPEGLQKSARTVFLGNVSTEAIKSKAAKKTLLAHLSAFFPSLPESSTPHKIESIRFRSTAFATAAVPKRAAFAKKELMDSTTQSTNAYVVYTTAAAARKAISLNGTIVLERHLRVDSIAHPAPIDNKRCVFVGNLGFVDEETALADGDAEKKRKKYTPPADVEEGLWRTFNQHAGPVESVRVVRDPSTRVGKGFAYVQFRDQNGVEAALLLDGKKFPPMLPRKLRVVRAKRISNKRNDVGNSNTNRTRIGGADPGLKGRRAAKLLGRAGAAQLRSSAREEMRKEKRGSDATASPFVFEGHRAVEGKIGTGLKAKTKNRGRPKTRSARRAKTFRDSKKSSK
ncbi:predicted protein [Uncinocarpus reesii 1704]|uniref:Nucleolar protein 12 n=1 Tax=Uncinocarpus reesii (strain UAMH 1704) TaxID=336963 RepID=C4JIH1_UNCRE|nr:uncharacterized protein UREG_01508 [Uncinocarpus reesii 1704]EEP76659.1 predicted protein [Uncinocarpus reesii 1704]